MTCIRSLAAWSALALALVSGSATALAQPENPAPPGDPGASAPAEDESGVSRILDPSRWARASPVGVAGAAAAGCGGTSVGAPGPARGAPSASVRIQPVGKSSHHCDEAIAWQCPFEIPDSGEVTLTIDPVHLWGRTPTVTVRILTAEDGAELTRWTASARETVRVTIVSRRPQRLLVALDTTCRVSVVLSDAGFARWPRLPPPVPPVPDPPGAADARSADPGTRAEGLRALAAWSAGLKSAWAVAFARDRLPDDGARREYDRALEALGVVQVR